MRAARRQDRVTLRPRRTSTLGPHADYPRQRWQTGNVMIKELQRELHEQGFDVSYSTLREAAPSRPTRHLPSHHCGHRRSAR
ncbi:hypothetical protein ACIBL5_37620 [Streptomyces sp. NPDC050516]|uniref:hypothetical protein n=1 Tax=Streptomyces sp. NPDC050516 TaxID=3365621 RepID=UPI0037ADE41C